MQVAEMLERIGRLPEEWKHPDATTVMLCLRNYGCVNRPVPEGIALDLHLRAIAEKLAERGFMVYLGAERWNVCDDNDDFLLNGTTYALALISAAEECNKI